MVVVVVVVVVGGGVVVVVALVVVDVVGIGVVVLVVVVGFAVVVVVVVVDVVDVVEVVDELNLRVGRTLPVVVVVGKLTVCKIGLSCSHRYDPGTLTHLSNKTIKFFKLRQVFSSSLGFSRSYLLFSQCAIVP